MIKKIISAITITLIISACGIADPDTPAQPGVETIVAATLTSLTASAEEIPPSFDGTVIAIDNFSFTLPNGLGTGAQVEKFEASPPSEDIPFWGVGPAYERYRIQGYPLQGEPLISIFPVAEYSQMSESAATIISGLQTLLNSQNQLFPEELPFLPIYNAAQVFHSNETTFTFQNGNGLRFITMYSQAPNPVVNNALRYTYQGLTSDGKYYVAAVVPINNLLLAENAEVDTQPPEGGIVFDWSPEGYEKYQTYVDSVVQLLNSSDPNTFTPSISSLDALMQSITVTP